MEATLTLLYEGEAIPPISYIHMGAFEQLQLRYFATMFYRFINAKTRKSSEMIFHPKMWL